jgi:AraC-like DNA-binding protein
MGELFFLGSILCAILTIYVLIFKEGSLKSYADYLLSTLFFLQIWCVVVYLLIYYGWITEVPHLYKTAAPINFIIPPLSYLYIRSVLYNEKSFNKKDLIHFIPFLLFFINYVPFYLLPTPEKKVIVEATTKNLALAYQYQAGLLPEYLNFILRPIQVLAYLIVQWNLVSKFKTHYASSNVEKQVKDVLKWLKVILWSATIFVVGFFLLIILTTISKSLFSYSIINLVPGIIISISFFVISVYLLIHPEVLAGLPFIKYEEVASTIVDNEINKIPFIREDYSKEIEAIENFFENKQPYLISNLSITQVAVILDIPVRELSYIINNYYSMRFSDFLNNYRVKHITNILNETTLSKFTIDSLALKSGFSSKSSFYRSFNKVYKCTPTEYLENLEKGQK